MPEIREVIVMEQFLNSLTPEIRLRVRERNPKTVEEAAKTADHLLQAKKQERSWYSIAGYFGRSNISYIKVSIGSNF